MRPVPYTPGRNRLLPEQRLRGNDSCDGAIHRGFGGSAAASALCPLATWAQQGQRVRRIRVLLNFRRDPGRKRPVHAGARGIALDRRLRPAVSTFAGPPQHRSGAPWLAAIGRGFTVHGCRHLSLALAIFVRLGAAYRCRPIAPHQVRMIDGARQPGLRARDMISSKHGGVIAHVQACGPGVVHGAGLSADS
jgi:hypothetical protein